MRFGPNSCRIDILRRAIVDGLPNGDFVAVRQIWCSWRAAGARRMAEGALVEDATQIVLRVNDTDFSRGLTLADRIGFKGRTAAIISVSPPDRSGGFIELIISTQQGG